MSLAEGLLLDGLYDPPIVEQHVYIAKRKTTDTSPGRGTAENPYRGNTAAEVDAVMASLTPNATVRFGPGEFLTNGTAAYSIPDSVRIVGEGRDVTTIKIATAGAYAFGTAISGVPSPIQRIGVEIADLCIDCGQIGGAIAISGVNNFFRSLRIINYAPISAGTHRVIVQLANSAAGRIARNCVLDDCFFDTPGPSPFGAASTAILVQLVGSFAGSTPPFIYYPHEHCVVRRCVFDAVSIAKDVIGIDAGLGRGLIVEENFFSNIETGIWLNDAPAIDLIFWNNAFNVVSSGITLNRNSTTPAAGRIVIIENTFTLDRTGAGHAISSFGSQRNKTLPT